MTCTIPPKFLAPGAYSVNIGVHIPGIATFEQHEAVISFTIEETGSGMEAYHGSDYGTVLSPCKWCEISLNLLKTKNYSSDEK